MFRRLWSGLPQDASFPSGLKDLGYFINDEDEIRSIEDPDYYFKFFISRNPRVCARQRFVFNQAMEAEIHARLENEGLVKVPLPLGAAATDRHVPIFASRDLAAKSRVVVMLGEASQDLGVLAGRVANGPGGIDSGSAVSVVRAIHAQASSATDAAPPGIVIANPGQLCWWPEGRRPLTATASAAVPLPSLVHVGHRHVPELNGIQHNETPAAHMAYVLDEVLPRLASPDAAVTIIAIGASCEFITHYLDDAANWAAWCHRLSSLLLLGDVYPADGLTNDALRHFLAKRARAYVTSDEPLDTGLAPPGGNPDAGVSGLGCPCYSSSEPLYTELILVRALASVVGYAAAAAAAPDFENPPIAVAPRLPAGDDDDEWDRVSEDQRPMVSVLDPEQVAELARQS